MSKTGLCMVTGVYYPEITGGSLQCRSLILKLPQDLRSFVIAGTNCKKGSYAKDQEVPVYRISISGKGVFKKFSSALRITWAFLKVCGKVRIIHIHGFSRRGLLFILLGKIFRKKILIKMTMPGADDPESVRRLMGRAAFYFFQQADAFILASPVFNSRLLPEKKLYRIPNGVDTQKFRPLDSRAECNRVKNLLGLPEEKKNILFVGYFSPLKGVDLLLEAWQLIRSRYKDTARIILISSQGQCSFYVDAGFKKELEEKISSWVIGEEIILVDKTLEISDYYKAADIFVLPSRIEGMPNALLEGMASSLPSLSSDIPAVTKIICDRENGMLFESGKSADLAEKIKILLDDPGYAESLGKKARESVLENFSLEKVARQYAELYRKIAAA